MIDSVKAVKVNQCKGDVRIMIEHYYNRLCEFTRFNSIPEFCGPELKGGKTVLLDVPGFIQTDGYSCGFLSALAVLRTFKPKANARRLYNRVKPCTINGTPTSRLVTALRKSGIVVGVRYRMGYTSLIKNVMAGFPTIVSTGEGGPDHWAVVVGASDKHVYLMGHGPGWLCSKGRFTQKQFERIWCPKGFGLVCSGK
ncbi:MAG: hypothetical protein H0X66_21230 [Verrucomicrobia bacterium]|nr:hypothetical protein [Verrucomicrobiota bacterium]